MQDWTILHGSIRTFANLDDQLHIRRCARNQGLTHKKIGQSILKWRIQFSTGGLRIQHHAGDLNHSRARLQ